MIATLEVQILNEDLKKKIKGLLLIMNGVPLSSYHNYLSLRYFKPKEDGVKNSHLSCKK